MNADEFTVIDGVPHIAKAPGARKNYTMDFSDVLPEGVTIMEADVKCNGVSCDEFNVVASGTMVQAWISGGAYGQQAKATFYATLTDDETIDPRTMVFHIRDVG